MCVGVWVVVVEVEEDWGPSEPACVLSLFLQGSMSHFIGKSLWWWYQVFSVGDDVSCWVVSGCIVLLFSSVCQVLG